MRGAMAKALTCRLCGRSFEPHGGIGRVALRTYCKGCTAKADREITRAASADCRECSSGFRDSSRARTAGRWPALSRPAAASGGARLPRAAPPAPHSAPHPAECS